MPYVEYRNPGHLTKQINWISLTTRLSVTLTKQRISMPDGGHLSPYPYLTFFIEICLILWRLLIPKLKDLESSTSVLRCLWKFLLGKLFFVWHRLIEILLWRKKKNQVLQSSSFEKYKLIFLEAKFVSCQSIMLISSREAAWKIVCSRLTWVSQSATHFWNFLWGQLRALSFQRSNRMYQDPYLSLK